MKKYLVFCGSNYYPAGGWDDFKGDFDSVEECYLSLLDRPYDWWHIINSETGNVVNKNSKG